MLAIEADFIRQRNLSERMMAWYDQYVTVLRRLRAGVSPQVLHLFGGGGGSSEGTRRGGGSGVMVDNVDQPDYVRKFGVTSFVEGDALSWSLIKSLDKRYHFEGAMASPPCKWYSRAKAGKASSSLPLIPQTRDVLQTFFRYWALENVMGAASYMAGSSIELFGQLFGLRVDRARKIETSFPLRIDEAVRRPGLALRACTCLGRRRRWRRVDCFGRPEPPCCHGNIFAVQGTAPWRCTSAECAAAMDVDRDHMSFDRLAQAIPPAYSRLVWGQMCMQIAHDEFSVPLVSFDDHVADPAATSRVLKQWLRGAGDDSAEAGLALRSGQVVTGDRVAAEPQQGVVECQEGSMEVPSPVEDIFREVFYSHVGGFDQRWTSGSDHWLDVLRGHRRLESAPSDEQLLGRNTFVDVSHRQMKRCMQRIADCVHAAGRGTRVTAVVPARYASWLGRLGFRQVVGFAEPDGRVFMSMGQAGSGCAESYLDHDACTPHMDPRDRGIDTWQSARVDAEKRARAWQPVWWEPEFWRDSSMPAEVVRVMTEGAVVELERALEARDVPQYPFASPAARYEASIEADRAIAAGHMSYVPLELVEETILEGVVHPWTMTEQGDKWRACQDYSPGTNRAARSAPFVLPTAWDAKRLIKPGKSFFAKYDLRDERHRTKSVKTRKMRKTRKTPKTPKTPKNT